MKDYRMLMEECQSECDKIGIRYGDVVSLTINTRAKKRFGQCSMVGKKFEINVSSLLVEDSVSDSALKDTLMHELLHTVPGCFNHGEQWKHVANMVNNAYGYNIKRTSSFAEKGIDMSERQVSPIKYQFVCTGCGAVVNRSRASKFTKYPDHYKCAKCGGKFRKVI